jgi:hypothetical protein
MAWRKRTKLEKLTVELPPATRVELEHMAAADDRKASNLARWFVEKGLHNRRALQVILAAASRKKRMGGVLKAAGES